MTKVGIVVLADTETKEGLGRVANALTSARDFEESGDEVAIIFDGAGTRWIGELSDPDHKYNKSFESQKNNIAGACSYCAAAFGVKGEVEASGVSLMEEYEGHPSLARLVSQGYQVITF